MHRYTRIIIIMVITLTIAAAIYVSIYFALKQQKSKTTTDSKITTLSIRASDIVIDNIRIINISGQQIQLKSASTAPASSLIAAGQPIVHISNLRRTITDIALLELVNIHHTNEIWKIIFTANIDLLSAMQPLDNLYSSIIFSDTHNNRVEKQIPLNDMFTIIGDSRLVSNEIIINPKSSPPPPSDSPRDTMMS